jgi:serine/threonine-protein kinase RsbW
MTGTASHRSPHAIPSVSRWTREFPARPEQVGHARALLAGALGRSPVTDDAVLCLSELAGNSVLHSASRRPGGAFTVRVELRHGDYVRIEVRDEGGAWGGPAGPDGRAHGLAIVRALAAASGTGGDAVAGWIAWARLDWPGSTGAPDGQAQPGGARPDAPT